MLLPYLHEIRQTGLTTQCKPSKVRAEDVLVSSWRQRGGKTKPAMPFQSAMQGAQGDRCQPLTMML